jgi:thiamine-monophosphate kinase
VSKIFRSDHNPTVVHAGPSSAAILTEGVTSQDDCAVFKFNGDQELVVGSDYIRGSKFRLYEYGLLSNYDIGYYLVAANISDVAAMGARPIGLLTVVRYPPQMSDEEFSYVLEGIRDACAEFNTPNVGGDIGGAERLILSATALGVCRPGGSLLRRGAQPGDVLCITGSTGTAGAAMQYFRSGKRSPDIEAKLRENLLDAWRQPVARVREGICLGDSGLVTACQDTSDGLKATIESISVASGVGFIVNEESLLVPPEVTAVCNFIGLDVLSVVMGDSVDFQLVFTVPERHLGALQHKFAKQGLDMWPIGQATTTKPVVLRSASGTLGPLPGEAWRHAPEMSAVGSQGPTTRR